MLRKRVITVLAFNDGVLFRTKEFTPDYRYTLNFVDAWAVDEIVVLDITRKPLDNRAAFKEVIRDFSSRCFVPMAAGGGIRNLEDVHSYMNIGADKVVLNTGAIETPELISQVSKTFGKQCAVVCIDVRRTDENETDYAVYSHFGKQNTGMSALDWAKKAEDLGAGEIMVSSIERDGSLQGYELDVCRQVAQAVGIPVQICGGAGNWKHFEAGFKQGLADAVCTTNIYHFTETSIRSAKNYLQQADVLVRN